MNCWTRSCEVWTDITSGVHAPLGFRIIVQPLVAAFFAIRAGRQDARAGRPLYFWAVVKDAVRRRAPCAKAGQHVGMVFISAIVIDVIYQIIVARWVYRVRSSDGWGAILAILPYLVFRGVVNRVLRRRHGAIGGAVMLTIDVSDRFCACVLALADSAGTGLPVCVLELDHARTGSRLVDVLDLVPFGFEPEHVACLDLWRR